MRSTLELVLWSGEIRRQEQDWRGVWLGARGDIPMKTGGQGLQPCSARARGWLGKSRRAARDFKQ